MLGHAGSDLTSVLPVIRAFNAIRPLSAIEAEALWPLLVLRTAVLIVSGAQQAGLDPDNDYVTEQSDGERRMFEQATSVPMDVMTEVIKADLGLTQAPAAVEVATPLVDAVDGGDAGPVDHVGCVRRRSAGSQWMSRISGPVPPSTTAPIWWSRCTVSRG